MPTDPSFEHLMSRARAGDSDAINEIYNEFASRVIALARSRLDSRTRQKEDEFDVAQSVFKSFFRRHQEGKFRLEDWENIWGVLLVMTLRKCGHRIERWGAQRRNVQQEMEFLEAIAREPTPSEEAMLRETITEVMESLHERERPILELTLQGYKPEEISTKIDRTERTVYRVLNRVKEKLEKMRAASIADN